MGLNLLQMIHLKVAAFTDVCMAGWQLLPFCPYKCLQI